MERYAAVITDTGILTNPFASSSPMISPGIIDLYNEQNFTSVLLNDGVPLILLIVLVLTRVKLSLRRTLSTLSMAGLSGILQWGSYSQSGR